MAALYTAHWWYDWTEIHRHCSGVKINREACVRGWSVTCRVLLVGEGSVLSFHIYQTANSADSQICSAWCLWAVKSNLKSLNHDLLVRKPSRDGLELCNDLSPIICWDRFPFLQVDRQVLLCFASFCFEMLRGGLSWPSCLIDKLISSCLRFEGLFPSTSPVHPPRLFHPSTHRQPRLGRAPVCSRQLWVGGSWLSVEHSRGEVTPLIPWV